MIIKCTKCGKMYDDEKYYGICPKCGRYNKAENQGEQEHQALHDKYDGGYEHTEEENHHRFHNEYDSSYQHAEVQESSVPQENSGPQQSRPMNKLLKILLIIFLLQFGIRILFALMSFFMALPFF
ncbi:MAG: hypothetical protein ACI4FZ_05960 [Lachnospiraceae bacterium]